METVNLSNYSKCAKIGCAILKRVFEAEQIQELKYEEFRALIKTSLQSHLPLLGYIGDEEVLKMIFHNFKEFSMGLSTEGVLLFNPETSMICLTELGLQIGQQFEPKVAEAMDKYNNAEKAAVVKLLTANGIKFQNVAKIFTKEFNRFVPCVTNQHFTLFQNAEGQRVIMVFGLGLFQIDDYNVINRPEFTALQTIVE